MALAAPPAPVAVMRCECFPRPAGASKINNHSGVGNGDSSLKIRLDDYAAKAGEGLDARLGSAACVLQLAVP